MEFQRLERHYRQNQVMKYSTISSRLRRKTSFLHEMVQMCACKRALLNYPLITLPLLPYFAVNNKFLEGPHLFLLMC